jgi:hypothetical protein
MNRDKIYSLILAFILTYFVPSLFLIPLLGSIIYSHPYTKPLFYYLDNQIDNIVNEHNNNVDNDNNNDDDDDDDADYNNNDNNDNNNSAKIQGCQEILKSGKLCRFRPVNNGIYCKRHMH